MLFFPSSLDNPKDTIPTVRHNCGESGKITEDFERKPQALHSEEYLQKAKVNVIEWLAQCTDLNPTEVLQTEVNARRDHQTWRSLRA